MIGTENSYNYSELIKNIIDIIWSKNYAFKQLKYDAVFFVDKEYDTYY